MNTRIQNKEKKRLHIINSAATIFTEKGLYDVQMQDIADAAGIGIATLFRYFPKKELIIVAVACGVMSQFEEAFANIAKKPITAYEKIEELLHYFLTFTNEDSKQLIRFRECFESYASFRAEPLENIEHYQQVQRSMIAQLMFIIEQGQHDGSINAALDIKSTLFTIINCFGKFTAKLSLHESLAELPDDMTNKMQQQIMMELFLKSIKP
ncbi:TetR/AcrR family transcriptional regulator [Solibacillus sp. CAU 1738]|uniref:TetR/AcrR family transcriptional regulator n=1 Tax=Solibacillus sp. CAU 1738 TaxID=3140363 RepID=UPI003261528D